MEETCLAYGKLGDRWPTQLRHVNSTVGHYLSIILEFLILSLRHWLINVLQSTAYCITVLRVLRLLIQQAVNIRTQLRQHSKAS